MSAGEAVPEGTGRARRIGLVADPGLPSELVRGMEDTLPGLLRERLGEDVDWTVEAHEEVLPVAADGRLLLDGPGLERRRERGWDTVVAVVDLPRFEGGRGVVADVVPDRRLASVCVPALGVVRPRRRLEETIVRVLAFIDEAPPGDAPDGELDVARAGAEGDEDDRRRVDEGRGAPGHGAQAHGAHGRAPAGEGPELAEEITPLTDTALSHGVHGEGRAARDESTVFVRGAAGTLRLLAGMVAANRPLRLARGMKWAVASAGAAGAYGVFYGSIWTLSNEMSGLRLTAVALLAVAMMVAWLVFANGLWTPGVRRGGRAALDNVSTLATVSIACLAVYAGLFAGLGAAAAVIIPMPYLSLQLKGQAGVGDMLQLVWLATSMGMMAGAVGASFDDPERIRTATYSRREAERRRLAETVEEARADAGE